MTAERWAQIKTVVQEAMEAPAAERAALLERTCGSDATLRREVESLLAAAEEADSLPEAWKAIATAAKAMVAEPTSDPRSLLAAVLAHQYDILNPLGRGGMGDVYLARERELERFVAIKVLRPDLALSPEGRERFRREARVAAQLTHPGILRLHTFGEVGGVWYFVMGYVRGSTLAERLRLEGRLPWTDAHRILTELADALEYAHRHGVVHRDVKPANILLDEESGHAILADFGISKMSGLGDSLTATGVIMGTPDYMSPEQSLALADVDERTDIYSLGAVAYTMLAGRAPFAGASTAAIMNRRLSQDPAPLRSVAPSVPEALASVVMKCLARDRTARWPDVHTLKAALARVGPASPETLPEEVRELPSFGPYALLWAVAWTAIALLTLRPPSERALLLLIALLVPVGLMLHVWNVGRHGLGPWELARIAYWPPEWWGMWWPRALRRPSDLWVRLPWMARFVRVVLSLFFLAIPSLIVLRQWLVVTGRLASGDPVEGRIISAEALVVLAAAVVVTAALWWARRRGLSMPEATLVLFGATTASPSWTAPSVARLLTPAAGRVRPPDRSAPADYRRAIGDLLRLLPASAAGAAHVAVASADRVLRAIEERDQELVSLARDASAADADRLAAQLTALGAASPGESQERRELRQLVRHHLDVVRRMRGRYESLSQQRAHLFDMLRGLWTQLCVACDPPAGARDITDQSAERLRAICAEIADELQAGGLPAPASPELSGRPSI